MRPSTARSTKLFAWPLLALLALSLFGCDGVLAVRGEMVSTAQQPLEDCVLELIPTKWPDSPDARELTSSTESVATFDETFIVSPWKEEYRAKVYCAGHSAYESEPFSEGRGGLDGNTPTVDLGKVLLYAEAADPAQPSAPAATAGADGKLLSSTSVVLTEEQLEEMRPFAPEIDDLLSQVELQHFTYSSDGLRIGGYMAKPRGEGPFPTVIWNRGGNREFASLDEQRAAFILGPIASWGYVVVASQYRGGTGSEGEDEFGGRDVQDVLSLIPLLDAMPEADTERLAMYGWSRGVLMTLRALTLTDRVDVAVLGAGTYDLLRTAGDRPRMESQVFSQLIPNYATEREEQLRARSAVYWADELPQSTPLLMLHGTADERVNAKEALTMAEALLETGHPFRLALYEGGDHGLREHRDEVDPLIRQWLEEHLAK
ncbi:MAG: prolyl oligopeptidase family serine peptidase [Acidobacteriota bacterium]